MARNLNPIRIGVVDDERFFREAIVDVLSGAGFECCEAAGADGALALARDRSVGVALLDLRLPEADAIELLRSLRASRPELSVIALASSSDQERVLQALREGASDYLAKPLHDEELILAVRRAAKGHELAQGLTRLRERLLRLSSRAEALARNAAEAFAGEDPERVHAAAVHAAAEVLEAEKASLLLLCEGESELRVVAAVGHQLAPEELDPVPLGEGVAGAVLESGEPLLVESVAGDGRFGSSARAARYESDSFAVVPLRIGDRALGVLCATERADGGCFGVEDVSLLRLLAAQTAEALAGPSESKPAPPRADDPLAAVAQTELVAASAETERDAELVREICDALVRDVEPERVIGGVLAPIARALEAAPVSLFLFDNLSGELLCEGQCDAGRRGERERLPAGRGLTGNAVQTGQLVATASPELDPRFEPAVDTPLDGVASPLLLVPIKLREKCIGVVRVFSGAHSPAGARTGELLAAALSAAVRNVLLYRSLLQSIEEVAEARREARS